MAAINAVPTQRPGLRETLATLADTKCINSLSKEEMSDRIVH